MIIGKLGNHRNDKMLIRVNEMHVPYLQPLNGTSTARIMANQGSKVKPTSIVISILVVLINIIKPPTKGVVNYLTWELMPPLIFHP